MYKSRNVNLNKDPCYLYLIVTDNTQGCQGYGWRGLDIATGVKIVTVLPPGSLAIIIVSF